MGKKYLVGYVGVMGQQEGIQYLIEAARHIVYDLHRTNIHFTLVGGGPSLEDFKHMAAEKKTRRLYNLHRTRPGTDLAGSSQYAGYLRQSRRGQPHE